ncbi:MAG: alpha-E domain-containing protein [Caulobacteraceae bacterium]|nr:alpha-E domain-containing protein [Caulobacter sp.]
MLARTADNLYWAARYVERADFNARLLDAAVRLSALPADYGGAKEDGAEWSSVLEASGVATLFEAAGHPATPDAIRRFIAFDRANPSSIVSCLDTARANARGVRTALTSITWEELNSAWNELAGFKPGMGPAAFARFLDWTKHVSLVFEGSAARTMLRNEAYCFLRLGTMLERADDTARLLDVKYHLLLPEREPVGGGLDYFQWTTLLREVSALTAYRWIYRQGVRPWLVAELLLLNPQLPASVMSAYRELLSTLDELSSEYGRSGESQRLAGATHDRLARARMDQVFASGLHEFITGLLADNARLAAALSRQYLLG